MVSIPIKASAKLKSRKKVAEIVYEFSFELIQPEKLDFKAGQYISIDIGEGRRRQYSISTSPEFSKTTFNLLVNTAPDGPGCNYLKSLKIDDIINFIGQIGLFILPVKLSDNLFFIATGTGIAPLKSMIDSLISTNNTEDKNIRLYFGTKHYENVLYEKYFLGLLNNGKITDYKIYFSCEEKLEKSYYRNGYVTKFLSEIDGELLKDAQYFICGNGNMIKSTEQKLLDKGISSKQIFYERYY
jgi:NAD(P)H-flavin reductase